MAGFVLGNPSTDISISILLSAVCSHKDGQTREEKTDDRGEEMILNIAILVKNKEKLSNYFTQIMLS